MNLMIVLGIILFLLLSAFFSSSEIAFLSADRLQLELDKGKGRIPARILTFLYKHPGKQITTILVGNNIMNVIYSVFVAKLLEPPLRTFISYDFLIVLIQTLVSTAIIIIFGEYIPKALAKARPNEQLLYTSPILMLVYIVLYPITLIASGLTSLVLWIMGIKSNDNDVITLTKVDLDYYIEKKSNTQTKIPSEAKLIQNALEFPDMKVRDCYIPRNEIAAVEETEDAETLIRLFDRTGYSKLLVYRETIDDIIGYIHSIEMFKCAEDGTPWQSHIKQTIYVPESLSIEKVMKTLLSKKRNIAIVVDELGGTAGIVTFEDIVEEIFGDIEDEHDNKRIVMRREEDGTYLISGRAEIDSINEEFGLDLPEDEEYKTLAGYILSVYQGIPERDSVVHLAANLEAKILRSTGNRITLVRLTMIKL